MKLLIVSFTRRGEELAEKVHQELEKLQITSRTLRKPFRPNLGKHIKDAFQTEDGIIFVGATGIAVRSIATHLKSKYTDPAIVVMDECGQYCISLLSGHVGGANALARQVAGLVGATPVITTATDINDCFAIDLFARQKELSMEPTNMCKYISSSLLEGEKVLVKSEFPILSSLPDGMELQIGQAKGSYNKVYFSLFSHADTCENTLFLMPRILTIGIGCRRGASYEKIENAVVQSLKKIGADEWQSVPDMLRSTAQIASVDLKKDEQGILQFTRKYHLPFHTFSPEELGKVEGEFAHSDYVKQVVGVDNVCERAAVKASESGIIIHNKTTYDGVTIAIAMADWSVDFV